MTARDLIDAFETMADAPNGIEELRGLVLRLAVTGTLVPQSSGDQPASDLVDEIRGIRSRLVAEKKLRKSNPLPPIAADDLPGTLPTGWIPVRLGDVVQVVRGITFPGSAKAKSPGVGLVACMRTANVQDVLDWNDLIYVPDQYVKRDDQYLRRNDIVMSMANSRELVGKVALTKRDPKQVSFGGFLSVIRPLKVLPEFLMHVLREPYNRNQLIGSATQTTNIANISVGRLNPLPFMLPPLAEQHRIVAKVDELMSLLDRLEAARDSRDTTRASLRDAALQALQDAGDAEKVQAAWSRISENMDELFTDPADVEPLRRTILQLAIRGRLAPQDPNDESASAVLDRIQAQKERLVKAGKLKKSRQRSVGPVSLDDMPFAVPPGWQWARLGDLSLQIHYGYTASADHGNRSNRFLRITDIQDNRVDWSLVPGCEIEPDKLKQYALSDGDIVIARTGGTVGKTYQVEGVDDLDAVFASYLIRVAPPQDMCSRFLKRSLETPLYWSQLHEKAMGTGQPNVNATSLSSLLLPVPPVSEQRRISQKVNELMAMCNAVEHRCTLTRDLQCEFASVALNQLGS